MIRILHCVHNREWQKGFVRWYVRTYYHVHSNCWSYTYMVGVSSHWSTGYPCYCLTIVYSALFSVVAKCPGPLNTTLDTMDRHREELGLGKKELPTVSQTHTHINTWYANAHVRLQVLCMSTLSWVQTHTYIHTHRCSKAQSWHNNAKAERARLIYKPL